MTSNSSSFPTIWRLCLFCMEAFPLTDKRQRYCRKAHQQLAQAAARQRRLEKALGKARAAEWESLCIKWGWTCAYCGRDLNPWTAYPDHQTPRSRGGSNDKSNILPSCRPCNQRKGVMTLAEFNDFREKA